MAQGIDLKRITTPGNPDSTRDKLYNTNGTLMWRHSTGVENQVYPLASGSSANTALSNLAAVAVNTSLVSDTDSTDNLGSTANYWLNTYTDYLYLSEGSAPSTPPSGKYAVYPKTDGTLYGLNDGGIEFAFGTGNGNVTGAASSTDNAFARFDSTTGKVIQNSAATLDDNGAATFPRKLTINGGANEATLSVRAFAGQTAALMELANSSGIVVATMTPSGGWFLNQTDASDADLTLNDDNGDKLLFADVSAANIGIGTNAPDASAKLDIVSTTKGFGLPAMTEAQRDAIGTPRDGLLVYNTDDDTVDVRANSAWVQFSTPLYSSIAILRDEKSTTTAGGSSSAATWNNRNLNTETYDPDGIVSISSNQFTPIAGEYEIIAVASAYKSAANRLRLYNVTGAASVDEGLSVISAAADAVSSTATLHTKFTANGSDAYRIDHYTGSAQATNGLGFPTSDGSAEVYLEIVLRKLA